MPQGTKRISRLLTDVNEIYPTLHTKINTLQKAGMSCSQKSYCIKTPYLLSTSEALMTISREIEFYYSLKRLPYDHVVKTESIQFEEFLLSL
jgi:hypothetical protein